MKCRFCSDDAVAVFTLDRGCFCYPNEQEQALCPQHVISAEPLGKMEVKEVLEPEVWAWMRENAARPAGVT